MNNISRIPLILFSILVCKALILSASWSDALVILAVGAISIAYEFKARDKQLEEVNKVIEKQNETILALAKVVDELRSSMSSVKMAQGMRTNNVGRL